MAVLSDQDRAEVTADAQRRADCPGALSKQQLREVVNAIDDWWEVNASVANLALPLPQRNLMTAREKASLFRLILAQRYVRS